jgi:protein arginine N-methyltransferase 3
MLDSVIYGRKNYLKEGGLILPNRCNVSIAGYGCEERYNGFIKFFENVYGYNMKCMLKDILREAHVECCEDEFVLTKPNIICEVDINTCDLNYSNFSYDFSLEVTKDAKMTSLVGYFDTFFDLPQEKISFSTSPAATQTHWRQTVFYLDEPVDVKVGEVIQGKFICQRDKKDLRSLKIEIKVFNKTFKYDLN